MHVAVNSATTEGLTCDDRHGGGLSCPVVPKKNGALTLKTLETNVINCYFGTSTKSWEGFPEKTMEKELSRK